MAALAAISPSITHNFSALTRHAAGLITRRLFSADTAETLKKTALHDLHVELGGKMVPFAGYHLPVQYTEGILPEHMACRKSAALFDVGHMLQINVHGKDRHEYLEKLTVVNLKALKVNQQKYSLMTNEQGGLIDDTVITRKEDHIYMVVNAACADKDMAHFDEWVRKFQAEGKDVTLTPRRDLGLVALQGPKAVSVLQRFVKHDLAKMNMFISLEMEVAGLPCLVNRCGYTGEDGFEISVSNENARELATTFLNEAEVKPTGLGARDSLRLEAGLSLYGNDLTETITPVEAGLTWTMGKRRKQDGGFLGDKVILKQLKEGTAVTRHGFLVKGVAREHVPIMDLEGNKIGETCSGGFSPILKQGIAMGYVPTSMQVGDRVKMMVRGKSIDAEVCKMPFVPTNYYSIPKPKGGKKKAKK